MSVLEEINSGSLKVILGSKSPRRSELLSSLITEFKVQAVDCEEIFPSHLKGGEIAIFLSELKSRAFPALEDNTVLITADTVVWMDGNVYQKPGSLLEAEEMLAKLSWNVHHVYTAVTLRLMDTSHTFVSDTVVKFEEFTKKAISKYVNEFNPLDKAGAYGIQDCLGEGGEQIGPLSMSIESGSYTNVIGLPVEDLKKELAAF